MDRTDLKTYQMNATRKSYAWTLDWVTQASFRHADANGNDNKPVSGTMPSIDEQPHNHWETSFCQQLRSGSFDAFRGVENCQILINNVPPLVAADWKIVS